MIHSVPVAAKRQCPILSTNAHWQGMLLGYRRFTLLLKIRSLGYASSAYARRRLRVWWSGSAVWHSTWPEDLYRVCVQRMSQASSSIKDYAIICLLTTFKATSTVVDDRVKLLWSSHSYRTASPTSLTVVPQNGFSSKQTRQSYSDLALLHSFIIYRLIDVLRLSQCLLFAKHWFWTKFKMFHICGMTHSDYTNEQQYWKQQYWKLS